MVRMVRMVRSLADRTFQLCVQPLPQGRVKEIGEMLLINAASQMTLQRPHYSSAAYVPAASERHRSQNVRYRRVAVAA